MEVNMAEGGIDLFIPKTYDIVWSLVILIILAVFFYKYFLPKFQAIFDERAEKIEAGIQHAQKTQEAADQAKQAYENQLSQARIEASKIREDAKTEASRIVAEARSQAESEARQITENAQLSIDAKKKQALISLKGEVGTLATALAGKILGSQLQESATQSSLVDSLIDDIGKQNANNTKA